MQTKGLVEVLVLTVVLDAGVIGSAAFLGAGVHESDHLLVVNLAVSPAFQGRGYGRVLLDYAEQLAGSLRLPEVKLFTNKQFTTNVEFYMRRGYTIDGEEPFMGGFLVHFAKRTVIS
jgi:GNAT superfamily N-acetyltransferase